MSLYNKQDAFEIYKYYIALKQHFNSSYDYFKYRGKVSAGEMAFENRKDKFFFYKLSKKTEAKDIILANALDDPNFWAGELLEDKAITVYNEWLKRKQSLTYQFQSDLSELEEDFNSNLIVEKGQHPKLLKLYMMRRICLETVVILCELTKCQPYWEKNISDNIVFPDINTLIKKYAPFLEYDKVKLRKILLDKYKET